MRICKKNNLIWVYALLFGFYLEVGRLTVAKIDEAGVYFAWQKPKYDLRDKILVWILDKKEEKVAAAEVSKIGGNVYEITGKTGDYGKLGTVLPRLIAGKIIWKI